jgi:glucosamine-6-phosphate deaminase
MIPRQASRADEIRTLLALSPDAVQQQADHRLHVLPHIDALHTHMADAIAADIAAHQQGAALKLILPVGPLGQYPLLAQHIRERNLSLADCWLFFMDEYCDPASGLALTAEHPLSFKRVAQREFFDHLPDACGLKREQVHFPDENNLQALPDLITRLGGIDACYGGIGIHGHIAFNEPVAGVKHLGTRKVRLNDFTLTINALRAQVGGNLENFPREAYTLGMTEILGAKRIRLYCRNGIALDWANTVLRLALLGAPGDDYPVTHIRHHPDYQIMTDADTLRTPEHVL